MVISTLLSVCSQGRAVFEQDRRELACAQGTSEMLAVVLGPCFVHGEQLEVHSKRRTLEHSGSVCWSRVGSSQLLCIEQIGASRNVWQEPELSSENVAGGRAGKGNLSLSQHCAPSMDSPRVSQRCPSSHCCSGQGESLPLTLQ